MISHFEELDLIDQERLEREERAAFREKQARLLLFTIEFHREILPRMEKTLGDIANSELMDIAKSPHHIREAAKILMTDLKRIKEQLGD